MVADTYQQPISTVLSLISPKDLNLFGNGEVFHPSCSMCLTLLALLTLCAVGRSAENVSESSAEKEKLVIARGKFMVSAQYVLEHLIYARF